MEEELAHAWEPLFLSEASLDLVRRQIGFGIDAWREREREDENADGKIVFLFWPSSGHLSVITTHPAFFYARMHDTMVCKVERRSADDIGALVECIMIADSFAKRFGDGIIIDASNYRCVHCGFESNRLSEMVLHFLDDCSFVKIKSALKD
jgi:hypothetical protein